MQCRHAVLFGFIAMTVPGLAVADEVDFGDVRARCRTDNLTDAQAQGRNAWSAKCGYIDAEDVAKMNRRRKYTTFSDGMAPIAVDAPCARYNPLTECYVGCLTGSQRLLFHGTYLPIELAAAKHIATFTTLSADAHSGALSYSVEPIAFFVSGNEDGQVVTLKTASGKSVEVTLNHPMIEGSGQLITAGDVLVGMELLTVEGPEVVTQVSVHEYHGSVWNIEPRSRDICANIDVAEGFLTGTIRFQNEWADDEHRLALRQKLDIENI